MVDCVFKEQAQKLVTGDFDKELKKLERIYKNICAGCTRQCDIRDSHITKQY